MIKKNNSYNGCVNVPIYQASTIIFDNLSELENATRSYARAGTDTNLELENKIAQIEGGYKSIILPSGLSAITTTLLSISKQGDHVLLPEAIYGPTRIFCDNFLKKYGVDISYYNCDEGIKSHIKENTKLIFLESPGSLTYDIDQIDEIVSLAKAKNIITAIDSTWSAGVYLKSFELGIDISVQSGSKYLSGHSDIIFGTITANSKKIFNRIYQSYYQLGLHTSPQDCYLALRGIQTLHARLKIHQDSAKEIVKFLEKQKMIEDVIHPFATKFKYKKRYKKYFSGSGGLISFTFKDNISINLIEKFVNELQIFKIGYSWGGYESLVMIYKDLPDFYQQKYKLPLIRIFIGIEDLDSLISDLKQSFEKLL